MPILYMNIINITSNNDNNNNYVVLHAFKFNFFKGYENQTYVQLSKVFIKKKKGRIVPFYLT